MFYEPEFVDSHLRVPNVFRKRYDSVLGMFIERLIQPYEHVSIERCENVFFKCSANLNL